MLAATKDARRLAIQLMVAQAALFSAETAIIHAIGQGVPVATLAFVRALGGAALALLVGWRLGISPIRTRQLPLQLLRGCIGAVYLWVLVYSFAALPFADATAISYTQAAYIAVFSVMILGETVSRARWGAAAIGILGALLIAKPAFASWSCVYLIALVGTSLNGLAFVLNRYLQREDSEPTTMFYTNIVPVVANLPALTIGGLPSLEILPWLPGILLLGPVGMYLGILAVRYASAAMLGPYTLLRLVIAIVAGVIVFREAPDALSICGAALILGSCLISTGAVTMRVNLGTRLRWAALPSRPIRSG